MTEAIICVAFIVWLASLGVRRIQCRHESRIMSQYDYERGMAEQDGPDSFWAEEFKRNFGAKEGEK